MATTPEERSVTKRLLWRADGSDIGDGNVESKRTNGELSVTSRCEHRFELAYRRAGAWLALVGMAASVLLGAGIGISTAAAPPALSRSDAAYGGSGIAAAMAQICSPGGLKSGYTVPAGPGTPDGETSFPTKCSHCCLVLELSLGKGGNSSQPVFYPSSQSFVWQGSVAMPETWHAAFWPFTRGPPSRT